MGGWWREREEVDHLQLARCADTSAFSLASRRRLTSVCEPGGLGDELPRGLVLISR